MPKHPRNDTDGGGVPIFRNNHSDEIVEELREFAYCIENAGVQEIACNEEDAMLLRKAADEVERLRFLITAWADAHDRVEDEWALGDGPELVAFYDASHALRKAVGR